MLDSRQARDLEKIYLSGNGYTLMQYASSKIFIKLLDIIHDKEAKIKVYVGHGNNGGDGYEVAALLLGAGSPDEVKHTIRRRSAPKIKTPSFKLFNISFCTDIIWL